MQRVQKEHFHGAIDGSASNIRRSKAGATKTSLLVVTFALICAAAEAQWLNFSTPGIPRSPDGRPDLSAPTPRTSEGTPDLSGVWMHDQTPLEEMKRFFGGRIEEATKLDVPGMEITTIHKYALDLLADFQPDDVSMTA